MPKYKFKRQEISTQSEIGFMIQNETREWLKALIAFLYLFGCRITEALNLKKRQVWVEEGYIVAQIGVLKRRNDTKGPYENMPHLIHVTVNAPFARTVLIPYLTSVTENEARLWPHCRQLVWLRLKGLNGLICPHVFRHDRLMKLALRGATEAELMDWAGWTDTRPAGSYIRATGRLAVKMADKID
jgi:integrase